MAELFKFRCYGCEKLIGAPPSKFGKVVNCPRCGVELIVPSPGAEGEATDEPAADSDPDAFRPEALGLDLQPGRIARPDAPSAKPPGPGEPDPVAFLELVAMAPEAVEAPVSDDPAADGNEPTETAVLPEPGEEPLVPRRRGGRRIRSNEASSRARDVVLPRTAAVAWALSGLLGLAFAFAAGLLIGHFLWR